MRSLEDIIDALQESTVNHSLNWEQNGIFYQTRLGNYRLRTWEWTDEDSGGEGATIQLLSSDGMEVLDLVRADEYSPKFSKIRELYDNARRSALGVDQIISELEAVLRNPSKHKP